MVIQSADIKGYLQIYSQTIGTGFTDEEDASRTIRTGFTDRIVVSHDTRELTEKRFLMHESLYKGHLAWLLLIYTFCNSMLMMRRLQLVQNSLCRVVTRSSKFSHITPQLKKLRWPPVRYRVQFKIGLITYKILNQGQPVYLRELIHPTLLSEILGVVPLNSSFFIPPLLTVEFINQLNTSLILLVTTPQFFGTLSPSK